MSKSQEVVTDATHFLGQEQQEKQLQLTDLKLLRIFSNQWLCGTVTNFLYMYIECCTDLIGAQTLRNEVGS